MRKWRYNLLAVIKLVVNLIINKSIFIKLIEYRFEVDQRYNLIVLRKDLFMFYHFYEEMLI